MDRGQATRQHLIETAAALFAEQGYEAVSTATILEASGVSRGALYHHFASKEAVFTAVLHATEQRIVAHLKTAAEGVRDPVDRLQAGCAAWLALAASDKVVRRVVLTDAPSVIGWQAWRALDESYTLGLIRDGLSAAAALGYLKPDRVDTYAHILLAVLVEVALLIARSPNDPQVARMGQDATRKFLESLLSQAPEGATGP